MKKRIDQLEKEISLINARLSAIVGALNKHTETINNLVSVSNESVKQIGQLSDECIELCDEVQGISCIQESIEDIQHRLHVVEIQDLLRERKAA